MVDLMIEDFLFSLGLILLGLWLSLFTRKINYPFPPTDLTLISIDWLCQCINEYEEVLHLFHLNSYYLRSEILVIDCNILCGNMSLSSASITKWQKYLVFTHIINFINVVHFQSIILMCVMYVTLKQSSWPIE